jgi:Zn finger protein HypA/HybF involved in hydrogenase expression
MTTEHIKPAQGIETGAATAAIAAEAPAVRIIFYCKDCYKVVEGVKIGKKYAYKCPTCHGKDVAFGTEKSIKSFYHVS